MVIEDSREVSLYHHILPAQGDGKAEACAILIYIWTKHYHLVAELTVPH